MTAAEMLAEFHGAINQHGFDVKLRATLHREETVELVAALERFAASVDLHAPADETAKRYEDVAQELADVVYVAYGTAHVLGIPLDRVLAEVHMANMSKFDEDGRPVLREDGKLLKSDRYVPPDIARAISGMPCPNSGGTCRDPEWCQAGGMCDEALGADVCPDCGGSGAVEATDENGDLDNAACTDCDGTGRAS